MLIFPDNEILIVTPPKNASTSLHTWAFLNKDLRAVELWGPVADGLIPTISRHTTFIPEEFRSFSKFVIVRHPYDRANSLYLHWQRLHAYTGDLHQFVQEILLGERSGFSRPQSAYFVDGAKPIYLESIKDSWLAELGEAAFPLENVLSDVGPGLSDISRHTLELLNFWASGDFRAFGFAMIGRVASIDPVACCPAFFNWKV